MTARNMPPLDAAVRRALYRRVRSQLKAAVQGASHEQILKAVEAETPAGTIAELLAATPGRAGEADDWAEEILRGAAHKAEMLRAAGGTYTTGQVAALLGVSVQAIQQRLRRKSLLALPLNNGEWGFPTVQFSESGVPAKLPQVLRAFGDTDPWVQLSILLSDDYGDGRIIDWIYKDIRIDDAMAIARSYGQQEAA